MNLLPKALITGVMTFAFLLSAAGAHSTARWYETLANPPAGYHIEDIRQLPEGGFILAGSTPGVHDDLDAWCAKLDFLGNVVWSYRYGGSSKDKFEEVRPLDDGSCFVVGQTYSYGAGDADLWCLLLGPGGNVIWQKTHGGPGFDVGSACDSVAGGGFIVAGTTASYGPGTIMNAWCLRLDGAGNVLWQNAYGRSSFSNAVGIWQAADGRFVLAGSLRSETTNQLWCLKLNTDGSVAWQMVYGGGPPALATGLQQATDGGYVLLGKADLDSFIMKLTANGRVLWVKYISWSEPARPLLTSVQEAPDGGYIACGQVTGSSRDCWLVKLDQTGRIAWQKSIGGPEDEYGGAMRVTTLGGLIVAGSADTTPFAQFVMHASWLGDVCTGYPSQDTMISPEPVGYSAVPATATAAATSSVSAASAAAPASTVVLVNKGCVSPNAPDATGTWTSIGLVRSRLNGTLVVTNGGVLPTGRFTVHVYLSNGIVPPRRVRPVKTLKCAGLPAFGSESFKIRASPGRNHKYIIAVIDAGNTVAEDDETNNTIARRFRQIEAGRTTTMRRARGMQHGPRFTPGLDRPRTCAAMTGLTDSVRVARAGEGENDTWKSNKEETR
ncbi:MAG: CARDB domain-containing protein [Acidobacteriota bacterium]